MKHTSFPKIGFIGPQAQSIDLALDLAVYMANKSENCSKDTIALDEIMDFHSISTPVWNSKILSVEFKDLDKFQITSVPNSRKALSLSKKYPEVLLSIETPCDIINVLNGRHLNEDDNNKLIGELMNYWDIEVRG